MRYLVVVALLVVACKREEAPPQLTGTAAMDALWEMAPEGATSGIVVAPRGISLLEGGVAAIKVLAAAAPDSQFTAALKNSLGGANAKLADVGLGPANGAAAFVFPDGQTLVILPVVDRDKVRGLVLRDLDGDPIGGSTCKTIKGYYACADSADTLAKVGKNRGMGWASKLANARGDIELVGAIRGVTIAAAINLDRGAAVLHGAVKGLPADVMNRMKASKPAVDLAKTASFAMIELAPMFAGVELPAEPIVAGVTVGDLVTSVSGPVSVVLRQGGVFDLHVPLGDPEPARKLLAQCDSLPVWSIASVQARVQNGTCHIALPTGPEVEGWIDGHELRFGKRDPQPTGATMTPTAAARELANGQWTFAVYGRGTLFGGIPASYFANLPPVDEVRMFLRALAMIHELGIGVRADGDIVRVFASVRTGWANPDDVVTKLLAIDPQSILDGTVAQRAKPIADAAPSSLFATDFKAGTSGIMLPAAAAGFIAGYAYGRPPPP